MRHPMKFLIPTLTASVLLAACGSSSSSKSASSTGETQPAAAQTSTGTSTALVKTASNSKLAATVLVDSQGMTLYHLSGEQNGKFICTSAACLQVWHPLTAPAGATPSGSVGSLSTVKRSDGSVQVTYKGTPLYTFAQDKQAGEANGQGLKDVGTWSAVTATTSAPATPASSGSGGTETSKEGGGRSGY
jgi:predicted lipoprotein with Yx(FWY)xxD motif